MLRGSKVLTHRPARIGMRYAVVVNRADALAAADRVLASIASADAGA